MSSLNNILNPESSYESTLRYALRHRAGLGPGLTPLPPPSSSDCRPSAPQAALPPLRPKSFQSPSKPVEIRPPPPPRTEVIIRAHEPHPDCPDTLACLPDTDGRPQHTLPVILRCTILGSPRKRLTIREIYAAMERKYPYYKTAGPAWKQSVRHHLSLNRLFERQPRPPSDPGFGSYWTVNLDAPPGTKRPRKRGGRTNKMDGPESGTITVLANPPGSTGSPCALNACGIILTGSITTATTSAVRHTVIGVLHSVCSFEYPVYVFHCYFCIDTSGFSTKSTLPIILLLNRPSMHILILPLKDTFNPVHTYIPIHRSHLTRSRRLTIMLIHPLRRITKCKHILILQCILLYLLLTITCCSLRLRLLLILTLISSLIHILRRMVHRLQGRRRTPILHTLTLIVIITLMLNVHPSFNHTSTLRRGIYDDDDDDDEMDWEDDGAGGPYSEDDYSSSEDMPYHHRSYSASQAQPGRSVLHGAFSGFSSVDHPEATIDRLKMEMAGLRRQSQDAINASLRLSDELRATTEELARVKEEATRAKSALKIAENMLEEETRRRLQAEKTIEEERMRRAADDTLRQYQAQAQVQRKSTGYTARS
ncbi:hypothetical protein ONZ51_g2257 [Trametes cubensis]|uniref:Fork-head domain-containing protein n=1 Tax=Trametes cubensis TaxID=1111947 RepID=A0AAD7U288_9APHY|nr:hypothetical protein ONZ51_g2257 [Trametes cubensis]